MTALAAVLAWRLGLGWLVGRRWALVTTTSSEGGLRRTVVPYLFGDGSIYLPGAGAYAADLGHTPRALVQAAPGPLGVRYRPPTPDEEAALPSGDWIVLEPTADPVPEMVPPDLVWLWPLLAALDVAVVLGWRRRPYHGHREA